MEQETQSGSISNPRKSIIRFTLAFLGVLVLVWAGAWGFYFFEQWRGERAVEQAAEALKKAEEEIYQKQLADTYGGKTPQETLRMYIEAVEKGDYELASKYFVEANREEELKSFNGVSAENIKAYVERLEESLEQINNGNYSEDKKYFSIYSPYLIRMAFYPNGTWKIIEI